MRKALGVTLLALLLAAPLFLGGYYMYVMNLVGISILLAVGLSLLTGFTGQISIGHAAFFGIGAYASALLTTKLMIPFWLSIPIGGMFAALISLGIGLPALRISGHYLALATLAFGMIIQLIFIHWDSLTNGPRGLVVPRPTLGAVTLSSDASYYYLILIVTIAFTFFAWSLVRSRIGRAFISIRDSSVASASLGIDLTKYKLIAFMISSFYAGVAGGLYGPLVKFIDPMGFGLWQSALYLMMIVVGGMASVAGAVIGAILLTVLPELLRGFTEYRELVYGVALLIFLIFMPRGIYGMVLHMGRRLGFGRTLG
jgi:branched-chain amino acid transport system permease protein